MSDCACPDCTADYNCPGRKPLDEYKARVLQAVRDLESEAASLWALHKDGLDPKSCALAAYFSGAQKGCERVLEELEELDHV